MKKYDKLVKHNFPFTQVPNTLICSSNITGLAKAIYSYLASRPNDWNFYTVEITVNMKESLNTVKKSLKELIDIGWIKREQIRVKGKFSHTEFTLYYELLTVDQKTVGGKTVDQKTVDQNLPTTNTNTTNTKKNNTNSTLEKNNFNSFREDFKMIHSKEPFYTNGLGWRSDTAFLIKNDLIYNTVSNRHVSKDEAFKIWDYLYENVH